MIHTRNERNLAARKNPSEHQEQCALIVWWGYECKRLGVSEKLLYAIPNAGAGASRGQAGKMKAEGTRAGIPDLMLAVARKGWHGLYLEMKALGKYATADQKDFHTILRDGGYKVELCRGAEEAKVIILMYLGGP